MGFLKKEGKVLDLLDAFSRKLSESLGCRVSLEIDTEFSLTEPFSSFPIILQEEREGQGGRRSFIRRLFFGDGMIPKRLLIFSMRARNDSAQLKIVDCDELRQIPDEEFIRLAKDLAAACEKSVELIRQRVSSVSGPTSSFSR